MMKSPDISRRQSHVHLRRSTTQRQSVWRNFTQPRWYLSAAAVLVFLLALLSAVFGQHGYLALRKQQQMLQQLEQERNRARAEQLRLKKELDDLRSPQGIERVAREEIKLAKPGEIVITLPESQEPGKDSSKADKK